MLMPDDLLTLARADGDVRRASAAAWADRPGRTGHAGRSAAIRALGRALVAAGTRLEGRSPGSALVPPAPPDPCDETRLARAA